MLPGGIRLEEAVWGVRDSELGDAGHSLVHESHVVFSLAPINSEIYLHVGLLERRLEARGLRVG